MPWKEKTVEELRKEFVEAAKRSSNFSSLCREFGISRKTGYKWMVRDANEEELSDRSRRPNVVANRTAPEIEQRIVNERKNKGWGAKKFAQFDPDIEQTMSVWKNRLMKIDTYDWQGKTIRG